MRRWMFPFCALLCVPLCAAADYYTLTDKWQVNFGRGQERAQYRTAACPDGTFYLSDNFGRVAVIDANGKVTSRQLRREFVNARALACDAASRLYVVTPGEIVIMRAGTMISRMPTDIAITALAIGSNGSIYASGTLRASSLPLHLIDSQGRVVKSFGIEPTVPFNRAFPRFDGYVLRQEDSDRVLYIPRWRDFEIQAYRGDGHAIGIFGAQGARILPVRVSDGESALGHAVGAARLPRDEIAVQREVADFSRGRSARMLEIYDSKLRPTGTAVSDMRTLAGAAADGDLYFTTLSPRGLQVFKVGLVKRLAL